MGAPKGNINAAKPKYWESALRRHFSQDPEQLRRIAAKVAEAAEQGESWAVSEIGNRLDGKAVQPVDMALDAINRTANELSNAELAYVAATGQLPGAEANESIN